MSLRKPDPINLKNFGVLIALCLGINTFNTSSYGKGRRTLPSAPAMSKIPEVNDLPGYSVLSRIESRYIQEIEPIFVGKCFTCHVSNHTKQWWQDIPLLGKALSEKKRLAQQDLDLSVGFPFLGPMEPQKNLSRIKESLRQDRGTHFHWSLLVWSDQLSNKERQSIAEWVDDGLSVLREAQRDSSRAVMPAIGDEG